MFRSCAMVALAAVSLCVTACTDAPRSGGPGVTPAPTAQPASCDAAGCAQCAALTGCAWSAAGSRCAPTCSDDDRTCVRADTHNADLLCRRAFCRAQTGCNDCLAIEGCNWTGGHCEDQCLMDTSCFGPGNPSASTCPAES